MNNNYDYTLSYMKALGILCVVAGHSYTGSAIEGFVGLFHMPLFFFISGYLFNDNKYINNAGLLFFKRKFNTLYWPTLKWLLMAILFHNVLYSIGVYNSNYPYGGTIPEPYNQHDFLVNIINAFVLRCNELIFAGIWFLRYLLTSSIICFFIIKYLKKRSYEFLCLIVLFVLSVMSSIDSIRSIFGSTVNLIFFSSFFYYVGFLWKKYLSKKYLTTATSLPAIILYLLSLICGYFFWRTGMINISVTKILPFTITAIFGILLIMAISKWIANTGSVNIRRYLNYIGSHTYDILMMHIIGFKLVTLAIIFIYNENIQEIANHPTYHLYAEKGWFILYIIAGICLPLILKFIYNKHVCPVKVPDGLYKV